jgi:outer membrane protein
LESKLIVRKTSEQVESQVKKILNCLVMVGIMVGTMVIGSGAVSAQDDGVLKLAVLDMTTALLNSEVAIGVDQELQVETAEDQQKVRNLAEQAQLLQERLQQDAEVMSESEQRRVVGELQELQNQYEFLVQKLQTLSGERMQQFQQTYAPNLVQAISEVVEEDGYDIVFRSEAALYHDNAVDITARVTEKLNQQ